MSRLMAIVLFLVSAACAQLEQVFYAGELDFHYSQLFGPFNGDFHVEGAIDTSDWMPSLEQGLGGAIFAADSSDARQLLVMGARRQVDVDTTYHVFGLLYRSEGPLGVGPVANPTAVNLFLLWNLDSLSLPDFTDSLDIEEVLGSLGAEHKFIGTATGMNITRLDATGLRFTFSGLLLDMDSATTLVTVSAGVAELESLDVAVAPSPVRPSSWLRLSPNPANPGTVLQFSLERPATVILSVHDLLGRQLEQRPLGWRGAGEHRVGWEPLEGSLPTGSYLFSLTADGELVASERLLLVK